MLEQKIGVGRLAALTGITQRSLIRYRNGSVVPRDAYGQPTANAWKLARALGVPLEELLPPDVNNGEEAA
jgi:transcriptional regulator with XRE-family HTH domain